MSEGWQKVTRSKPRPLGRITCPAPRVFAVLREPRKRRRFDRASQIPGLDDLQETGALSLAEELLELGLLARDHGRYTIVDWTIDRIVEHLALAGAIHAMAAAEAALRANTTDFTNLAAIHAALRGLDAGEPANLLGGAYLDYQFHLELVRLGGNQTAWASYAKSIPPAVWIAGANYFELDEARSSLAEHERLIDYMKAGDTLRARDAAAFHLEEAGAQIRRAGEAQIESYPSGADSLLASMSFGIEGGG